MAVKPLVELGSCFRCGRKENLTPCQGCHLAHFCDLHGRRRHQQLHEKACKLIQSVKSLFERAEKEVLDHPAKFDPSSVLEDSDSPYLYEVRRFMRRSLEYMCVLVQIPTWEAVQTAFDYMMNCLRLCWKFLLSSKWSFMNSLFLGLSLRLGREQESYDFIKWRIDGSPECVLDDTSLSLFKISIGDVFEDVEIFRDFGSDSVESLENNYLVPVMLIKIRLLFDLQTLQNSLLLKTRVPLEILAIIQRQLIMTDFVRTDLSLTIRKDYRGEIQRTRHQIQRLYNDIDRWNPNFWKWLLDTSENGLDQRKYNYDVKVLLEHIYRSWIEIPAAVNIIRRLSHR